MLNAKYIAQAKALLVSKSSENKQIDLPGVKDFEVGHADVVGAAVLLNVDRVPGDQLDVLGPAGQALELDGRGGEAEHRSEAGRGRADRRRQFDRQPRLQRGQLVTNVGLNKKNGTALLKRERFYLHMPAMLGQAIIARKNS